MKVRIGFGIGTAPGLFAEPHGLARVADVLDADGWDSLWFPERVSSNQLDPIVAMSYVAGCCKRLKFGSAVSVVPGRNPVLLAKAFASLDVVSAGRCLPAFGLGIADAGEHQAFGVSRRERAPWLEEAMPLIRRLWAEETVDHHGPRFSIRGARVLPKPVQQPLEVWLGGQAPSELRRTGRLGDGWLASFTTARQVGEGIEIIKQAAADADREIDPEHYGVLIPYATAELPPVLLKRLRARRADTAISDVIATSPGALKDMIDAFIEVGASKFVVFGIDELGSSQEWITEIKSIGSEVLNKQT